MIERRIINMATNIGVLCFLLAIGFFSFSCSTPSNSKFQTSHTKDNFVDSLLIVIHENEHSNLSKMAAAAKELLEKANTEKSRLLGKYYTLKASYYQRSSTAKIEELEEIYEKFVERDYEKYVLELDLFLIEEYFAHSSYAKASERYEKTMSYILKPEYEVEKSVLIYCLTPSRLFKVNAEDRKKALDEIASKMKDSEFNIYHSKVHFSIARYFNYTGEKEKATQLFQELIEKNIQHHFLTEASKCYNEISNYVEDPNRCIAFSKKAVELSNQSGHHYNSSIYQRVLGHTYFKIKDYENAFNSYLKTIMFDSMSGDTSAIIMDNAYAGWALYHQNKDFDQANEYYERALQFTDNDVDQGEAKRMALERKLWSLNVKENKELAIQIKEELVDNQMAIESRNGKALEYFNISTALNIRAKDSEIKALHLSNKLNDAKIARQNYIIIIAIAIISFFSLLLYYYVQKTSILSQLKERNNIINEQNQELQLLINELSIQKNTLHNTNTRLEKILERRESIIDRLKKFTSILSHDIKEPVRMIYSFGKLLKNQRRESNLNEREIEFIDYMTDGADRLDQMIDKLYSYSNNTLILMNSFKHIDLNQVVKNVQKDLIFNIENKNAQIKYDELHSIEGEEVMIYQLFQNLISNSLKYSKKDIAPIIEIKSEVQNEDLMVTIIDNGIGIDHESQSNVFELLKRSDNGKNQKGHGIGLATCKEIIELHKGKIWLDSTVGKGTNIKFLIPMS